MTTKQEMPDPLTIAKDYPLGSIGVRARVALISDLESTGYRIVGPQVTKEMVLASMNWDASKHVITPGLEDSTIANRIRAAVAAAPLYGGKE